MFESLLWGCTLLVNKKKNYNYTKTTINLRKSYFDLIKGLDISITEFLDKAIGRQLDVLNKSDEWILKEIDAHTKTVDDLKTLLSERKKDREELEISDKKLETGYKKFCDYLSSYTGGGGYKTKDVNDEFGINLTNYDEFKKLQDQHKNGEFSFKKFKELVNL